MAGDSALTKNLCLRNSKVTLAAAKAADDTGYLYVDIDTVDASKMILLVEVSGSDTNTALTIVDGAQYTGGAIGNLTLETSAAGRYAMGPLETARFKDSNGYIKLKKDTSDTTAVSVTAILLP